MYQLIRTKITDIINDIGKMIFDADLKYEVVPYWKDKNEAAFETVLTNQTIIRLFNSITNIYGTKTDNININNYKSDLTYVNHNKMWNSVKWSVEYKGYHKNIEFYRSVFAINDLEMYEIIDDKIYRTLLWYLIDPLAFIANVETNKVILPATSNFFNAVKSNIGIIEKHTNFCYWVLKHSYVSNVLVPDIIDTIMTFYIQDSLNYADTLMKPIKDKLNM